MLSVQGTTATYVVSYSGLKDDATLSHVHGPAARGANAGVAFGLVNPTGRSGMLVGQATITPAQAADIEAGKTYFNIHTKAFGGGEIRGQIEKP